MFAGQLISQSIPFLHLDDTAGKALQEMNDFHVSHLPIVADEKYLGLISEEVLLDNDEKSLLQHLHTDFIKPFVRQNDFFLLAVKRARDMHLSVVPVIAEQYELLGVISEDDLFRQLSIFSGIDEQGGIIVLEMEKNDFSAGELNRLIESNDAYITQLNSYFDTATQLLTVTIRINKTEISDIVATLQRHEYNIRYYNGEELYQNELQNNLDHLMNYLNI
ncbi:CBS domain-containing protein [Terrimonas sp.]|uniref:CBS domain-containing protein n=1 Tax=Terrimonas sp. TaxID=1914338 RepID=UPI000D5156A6|nr:CBS domain-containing protein [Terrimonas sp.]PVD51450.1 CBS domain-containing protein [Terrimonas sp.]